MTIANKKINQKKCLTKLKMYDIVVVSNKEKENKMVNEYGVEIIKYRSWEIERFEGYRVWVDDKCNDFRTQDMAEEFIDYIMDNLGGHNE